MGSVLSISTAAMDAFVGKSIEDICPLHYGKVHDIENHCAHFVGHVLKLNSSLHIGYTCAGMASGGDKHPAAGACIRVHEIFNACNKLEKPAESGCLAYFTLKGNVGGGHMGNIPKKHVGVYFQGNVWNYGNTLDKVRKDPVGQLANLYGSDTITLYTKFPSGATLLTLDQIKALAT